MSNKHALPVAVAAGILGLLIAAQAATATHPRPKGASPLSGSAVIAYNQCASPNRTHGPPLAFPSCNPPVQSSPYITVGTPDANGAASNMSGNLRVSVIVGVPG